MPTLDLPAHAIRWGSGVDIFQLIIIINSNNNNNKIYIYVYAYIYTCFKYIWVTIFYNSVEYC